MRSTCALTRVACVVVCSMLMAAASAFAHHSFAAEYDGDKPIRVSGQVVKIEWTNPHIHFYLDVKDDNGAVTQWRFEGYPPNMLVRQGWKRDETLKVGDNVSVFAWLSRTDPHLAHAREVTFADGRKMTAGPPAGTGGK